jgi:hypothetical protein
MGDHLINLQLIGDINIQNILEPNCVSGSPEPNDQNVELVRRYLSEKSTSALWCRVNPSLSLSLSLSQVWLTFSKRVKEKLRL